MTYEIILINKIIQNKVLSSIRQRFQTIVMQLVAPKTNFEINQPSSCMTSALKCVLKRIYTIR